jgi:hypothetical protein
MTVGEPVIGILIGMLALNEQFNSSPMALAWESLGALVMIWGTWLLARSPLVTRKHRRHLLHRDDEPPAEMPAESDPQPPPAAERSPYP